MHKYTGNTAISTKEQIQQDLNIIGDWSEAMPMPSSIVKCLVLHYGVSYPQWAYTCIICPLPFNDNMRDLGVSYTKAQVFSTNAAPVASKYIALQALHCIPLNHGILRYCGLTSLPMSYRC